MKFLISLVLIALLSFCAGLYFPWWSIAIVPFIVGLLVPQSGLHAFLSGFLGVAVLWAVLMLILSIPNDHILAHRVAPIFIKMDAPYLLILVTALMGGIIGGLSALSGNFLQQRKSV